MRTIFIKKRKKKKWIKHLFFFLLVSVFGGYALYDYYRSAEKTKEEEERARLLSQNIEDVQEIQLLTDGKSIILKRKDQQWMMEAPVPDFADSAAIASWFNKLKDEKVQDITPKENIQWEEYHLDDKASKISLSLKSNERITFSVSWKPSFDDKYFIRREDALLIGDNSFKAAVNEKTPDSFRSLSALHTFGHPVELSYEGKENFSFTWSDYRWSFKNGSPFPLNTSRLDKFWSDLSAFKATEIVEPATEEYLKNYGLSQPEVTIHLKFREQDVQIRVSAVRGNAAFIHASDRKYILECSQNQAEKLILSQTALRDHAVPFKYKKEEISLFELRGKTYSYTVKKNPEGVWESTETEDKKINSEEIKTILNRISKLKGEKYNRRPLWLPKMSLTLKNDKGETLLDLKAGQPFKDSDEEMLWVQTNLSKEKVAISKTSLDNIFEKDPYVTVEKNDKKSEGESTKSEEAKSSSSEKDSHSKDSPSSNEETN